jgi:hypothetical protein
MLSDSIFSFSGTAPRAAPEDKGVPPYLQRMRSIRIAENNLLPFDINSIKINKNQPGVNVSNKNLP